MTLLRVQGLGKAFGAMKAVDDVSFELRTSERLALIGPNGAGKSTCFNMIGGQLAPDTGRVTLGGKDITGLPAHRIWRRRVGRTFQIAAGFASMTVAENVQMALMSRQRDLARAFADAHALHRDEAVALLERVGMAQQASQAANELAYGDIKRVELAVALAVDPVLLLMDEPTAGMAPAERHALMELVSAIVAERDIAVLFTEHDMDVVFAHADRILVLARGQIIADGAPDQVREDPEVRAVYLGGDQPAAQA